LLLCIACGARNPVIPTELDLRPSAEIKDEAYLDLLTTQESSQFRSGKTVILLEIEPRETKDADRFRRDRDLAWHPPCLRHEKSRNAAANYSTIASMRSADRADF